jgi:hypothetical protein
MFIEKGLTIFRNQFFLNGPDLPTQPASPVRTQPAKHRGPPISLGLTPLPQYYAPARRPAAHARKSHRRCAALSQSPVADPCPTHMAYPNTAFCAMPPSPMPRPPVARRVAEAALLVGRCRHGIRPLGSDKAQQDKLPACVRHPTSSCPLLAWVNACTPAAAASCHWPLTHGAAAPLRTSHFGQGLAPTGSASKAFCPSHPVAVCLAWCARTP